jgi:hypothetical protein
MLTLTANPNNHLLREVARAALGTSDGRGRRVVVLLAGVAALSAGDLAVTLAYMQSMGMFEHNPIVRHLVRATGSAWPIVLYKCVTVLCAIGLLYPLRRRAQAEAAAWLGFAVLAGVSLLWWCYAREMADLDLAGLGSIARLDANWVRLH